MTAAQYAGGVLKSQTQVEVSGIQRISHAKTQRKTQSFNFFFAT
ncbi:MAG: hypothetical protein V7638_3656, partial [Acidobacteriota bacterium]